MRSRLAIVALALTLSACQPVQEAAAPTGAEPGLNAGWAAESKVLRLSAQQSELRLLVYRAGALARLGHNHVISAPELQGSVFRHPDLGRSQFEITIAVAALAIDDPQLRAQEGEGFESVPSDDDIAGTRRNMLSASLLDGTVYPEVRVTGSGMQDLGDGTATIEATIAIKGAAVTRTLPLELSEEDDRITVVGEMTLSHTELGLEPFSVMLGALQVAEEMTLKFRLVAET